MKNLEPLFKNIERCEKLNKIFNMKESINKEFGEIVNQVQPLKMLDMSNQSLVQTMTRDGSSSKQPKKHRIMDFDHFQKHVGISRTYVDNLA